MGKKTIDNNALIRINKNLLKSDGLKPCPFCGSNVIRVCTTNDFITEKRLFYAKCFNCEAESAYKEKEKDVVALWQNRA